MEPEVVVTLPKKQQEDNLKMLLFRLLSSLSPTFTGDVCSFSSWFLLLYTIYSYSISMNMHKLWIIRLKWAPFQEPWMCHGDSQPGYVGWLKVRTGVLLWSCLTPTASHPNNGLLCFSGLHDSPVLAYRYVEFFHLKGIFFNRVGGWIWKWNNKELLKLYSFLKEKAVAP